MGEQEEKTEVVAAPATTTSTVSAEQTVPKSRFDEVYEQKKAADEKAKILQDALNQTKAETEEEKNKRTAIESQVLEADRRAWRANALRSIPQPIAQTLDDTGASFSGNSQEEYLTWANTMAVKLKDRISVKASVDGNRSTDTPTEITPEVIAAMSNEERLKYLSKTLPRAES